MRIGDANALRLCLCCGQEGAELYRLRDGRANRTCHDCESRCAACAAALSGATQRAPIGREIEFRTKREERV